MEIRVLLFLILSIYITGAASETFIGDLEDFCQSDPTKKNDDINKINLINFISEDEHYPGSLLVAVTRYIKRKPNSQLLRIHSNGSNELLAGTRNTRTDPVKSFTSISSFVQLNRTSMVIVDNLMNCIRLLHTPTKDVATISGKCFIDNADEIHLLRPCQLIDGDVQSSRYCNISSVSHLPGKSSSVLLPDGNTVRELNIDNQTVKTVFTHSTKNTRINEIIWREDFLLLSSNQGLDAYYQNWTFKEHLTLLWIPTLTGQYYSQIKEFHMSDLSKELIALTFITEVMDNVIISDGYTQYVEYEIAVLYSLSKKTAIAILYDENTLDSLLPVCPSYLVASQSGTIYVSTGTRWKTRHYCSMLKTLAVKNYCTESHVKYPVGTMLSANDTDYICELNYTALQVDWKYVDAKSIENTTTVFSTSQQGIENTKTSAKQSTTPVPKPTTTLVPMRLSTAATSTYTPENSTGVTANITNYTPNSTTLPPQTVTFRITNDESSTVSQHTSTTTVSPASSLPINIDTTDKAKLELPLTMTCIGVLLVIVVGVTVGVYCKSCSGKARSLALSPNRPLPEPPATIHFQVDSDYCWINLPGERQLPDRPATEADNDHEYSDILEQEDHSIPEPSADEDTGHSCTSEQLGNGKYVTGARLVENTT